MNTHAQNEYSLPAVEPFSACTCFNCDVDSPMATTVASAEDAAGASVWVLGLDPDSDDEEAVAVYACGICATFLIDTHPVSSLIRPSCRE